MSPRSASIALYCVGVLDRSFVYSASRFLTAVSAIKRDSIEGSEKGGIVRSSGRLGKDVYASVKVFIVKFVVYSGCLFRDGGWSEVVLVSMYDSRRVFDKTE